MTSATIYRIAHSPKDYKRCKALVEERGESHQTVTFPTVLAERDGELLGFLGTDPRKDCILAEPLVLRKGKESPFLFVRLVEAYEVVMRKAGVKQFLFAIEKDNPLLKYVQRVGFTSVSEEAKYVVFARDIA